MLMGLLTSGDKRRLERGIKSITDRIEVAKLKKKKMVMQKTLDKEENDIKLLELESDLVKKINDIVLLKNTKKKTLDEIKKEKEELEAKLIQVRAKISSSAPIPKTEENKPSVT